MGAARAGYAVFVQDPSIPMASPGEGLAKLYNLASAELRVEMAIASGNGDTADVLGLAVSTIKSHLQRVFTKTSTTNQAELLALNGRSLAPLAGT